MNTLASPPPYPFLEISTSALDHNLALIRNLTSTKVLIPVKANAYGFGLDVIMPYFIRSGVDWLGVANPHEGELIRTLGWQKPILNLGGFFPENASDIFYWNITPSLTDIGQIEILEKQAEVLGKSEINVHIKWDLGMGRIGIREGQAGLLVEKLREHKRIKVTGLFTHFPNADNINDQQTSRQNSAFIKLATAFMHNLGLQRENIILHAANSYAMINYPETHFDMVRPGILFYGYFQNEDDRITLREKFPFRPGLRLKAYPISLRRLEKGDSVSYGSRYTVEENNYPVGVIPVGYGDGLPRAISNKVKFSGFPLLGTVTMDQIVLGGLADYREIHILGEGSPSVEKLGDLADSFSYEIITGLGNRLRRVLAD